MRTAAGGWPSGGGRGAAHDTGQRMMTAPHWRRGGGGTRGRGVLPDTPPPLRTRKPRALRTHKGAPFVRKRTPAAFGERPRRRAVAMAQ